MYTVYAITKNQNPKWEWQFSIHFLPYTTLYSYTTQLCVVVKSNLNNLGVKHDNFVNETDLINKKEVEKVVELLKNKNFVYEGKIDAPKSENNSDILSELPVIILIGVPLSKTKFSTSLSTSECRIPCRSKIFIRSEK